MGFKVPNFGSSRGFKFSASTSGFFVSAGGRSANLTSLGQVRAPTRYRQSPIRSVEPPARRQPRGFAPSWQKAAFKAVSTGDQSAMASIGSKHVDARNAMLVLQMIPLVGSTDGPTQLALGRELWASGYDPAGEEYFTTYEAGYTVEVTWSPGFTSTGPINRFMIGMLVAELEFQMGNIHQAIAIVGELPLNSATRSYRAYLLGQIGEWDAIISLAESQVLNENEMDTLTFIMRGIAVRETGQPLVANVYFQAALAKRSHRMWVRTIGYMERAKSYLAAGKKPMARKDLERVLAAEPNHPEALALMSKLEITPS